MQSWEKIDTVSSLQNYIHQHYTELITLRDLAKHVGYSTWHCSRLFKDVIGKSPFEYIRDLRLSEAANTLVNQDMKVIDVALDFVFDSHEGFTRAFSKRFGISPKSYQITKKPIDLFIPFRIKDYYLMLQKGEINMENKKIATVFTQVVERPERKLILKRGRKATHYFEYCEEVGDVWGTLVSIQEALFEPTGFWLNESLVKEDTSSYVQGVEVVKGFKGDIPEGFEIIDLPATKMMIFQGEPYDDDLFQDAISEVWEAINNFNPELYGYKWADKLAPRFQLEPQGYRGYIEARPVEQL